MTQGLGIMSNIKLLKAAKYFAVSLIISSSISITANAQPEDAEIMNIAAQLGLLQAAPSHNIQQTVYREPNRVNRATYQPRQRVQKRTRASRDPYAEKKHI